MPHVRDSGDGETAPFVSFLTSAYRTERYVSETIESASAQTRGDCELIVVDNGNSDEMARIIGNYTSDPRITLIRQENKGIGGGVSAAANAADGRDLCPLASDDALDPHYCERIGPLIDADRGVDAVGCNAVLFWDLDADNRQKPRDYFAWNGRKTTPDLSRSAPFTELLNEGVPPYAGAIRREAWGAHGGYEPPADVEDDVAPWLRLVAAGHDGRILPDKPVRIRERPDSSSRDPSNIDAIAERLERTFLLLGRGQGLSESAMAATGMLRRWRYLSALRRARSALLAGDVQAARTAARDAFQQRRTVRAAAVLAGLHVSPGSVGSDPSRQEPPGERAAASPLPHARSTPPRGPRPAGAGGRTRTSEGEL